MIVLREPECCAGARTIYRSLSSSGRAGRPQLKRDPLGGSTNHEISSRSTKMDRLLPDRQCVSRHRSPSATICHLPSCRTHRLALPLRRYQLLYTQRDCGRSPPSGRACRKHVDRHCASPSSSLGRYARSPLLCDLRCLLRLELAARLVRLYNGHRKSVLLVRKACAGRRISVRSQLRAAGSALSSPSCKGTRCDLVEPPNKRLTLAGAHK